MRKWEYRKGICYQVEAIGQEELPQGWVKRDMLQFIGAKIHLYHIEVQIALEDLQMKLHLQ
jgi:hypothetical protein